MDDPSRGSKRKRDSSRDSEFVVSDGQADDEEIPKQQTKLRNLYSISRYKRNTTKMSKVLYHNSNKDIVLAQTII